MLVYPVQKGDTLWKIAQRFNIGLDALIAANPQISDPNYIVVGQQINIPELWTPAVPSPEVPEPLPIPEMSRPQPRLPACSEDAGLRPCIYTTRQGDTLEYVSGMFQVPIAKLLYYNLSFAKNEPLAAGTRIIIPETDIMPLNPHNYGRRRR